MIDREQLERAIALLESHRAELDAAVVELALAPLRAASELLQDRAASLETEAQRSAFLGNIPAHRAILAARQETHAG